MRKKASLQDLQFERELAELDQIVKLLVHWDSSFWQSTLFFLGTQGLIFAAFPGVDAIITFVL